MKLRDFKVEICWRTSLIWIVLLLFFAFGGMIFFPLL